MSDLPAREKPAAAVSGARGGNATRILALDYGQRRIGMAISDELRMTAQPLGILERTNRRNDLRRLREIVRRHGVQLIVVGHPLRLDGTVGEMADEAARFAHRLARELGVEVRLADERLTSWEAGKLLRPGTKGGTGRRREDDDGAAAVLLRDFLSRAAGTDENGDPSPRKAARQA
jgi:putative holliday junction resolvase